MADLQYLAFLPFLLEMCSLFAQTQPDQNSTVKDIYILGLLPMEGSVTGRLAVSPAAEIAVEYVNKDPYVLPGYRLRMIWNDTMCNPGRGVKVLAENMCHGPTFSVLLGDACSIVSEAVAQAAHFWNLVQISFLSTSLALSDKKKFPYFFRVINSEGRMNYPRIEILKHFNWTKVTTVHQSYKVWSTMIEELDKLMIKANITIIKQFQFSEDPAPVVSQLKEYDARIIIGGFYEEKARALFCKAYKTGFFGPKIVWLLPGDFTIGWWKKFDTSCTPRQILLAAGNYITVDNAYYGVNDDVPDDNGITRRQFLDEYHRRTDEYIFPGDLQATTTYDAVWTIARALNATISDLRNTEYRLEDFSYTETFIGQLIKNNTSKVNFTSISNRVFFDENGDVIKSMRILQMQDKKLLPVGWYNEHINFCKTKWGIFVWESEFAPKDSMQIHGTPMMVTLSLYITMCTLATAGILMAVFFLIFNIRFNAIRIIKMSSPRINNIILMGCVMLYLFVFVHGIDTRKHPPACQASVFVVVMGFSLAYGALFAKTWRVHVIYTASMKLKKRAPKDYDLYAKIGVLTSINTIIMIAWTVVDPLEPTERKLDHLKTEEAANDRVVVPVTWNCTSDYEEYFYGALVVVQGITLLLGVFLAFTTRKVTIPELNDSKYIGMCIYNVIVLASVGLPVALMMKGSVNVSFGLLSGLIIAGTTTTQCLIFIPKVNSFRKVVHEPSRTRNNFLSSHVPNLAAHRDTEPIPNECSENTKLADDTSYQ